MRPVRLSRSDRLRRCRSATTGWSPGSNSSGRSPAPSQPGTAAPARSAPGPQAATRTSPADTETRTRRRARPGVVVVRQTPSSANAQGRVARPRGGAGTGSRRRPAASPASRSPRRRGRGCSVLSRCSGEERSAGDRPAVRSTGRHAQGAVHADDLTVEVAVLDDVQGQLGEVGRAGPAASGRVCPPTAPSAPPREGCPAAACRPARGRSCTTRTPTLERSRAAGRVIPTIPPLDAA